MTLNRTDLVLACEECAKRRARPIYINAERAPENLHRLLFASRLIACLLFSWSYLFFFIKDNNPTWRFQNRSLSTLEKLIVSRVNIIFLFLKKKSKIQTADSNCTPLMVISKSVISLKRFWVCTLCQFSFNVFFIIIFNRFLPEDL